MLILGEKDEIVSQDVIDSLISGTSVSQEVQVETQIEAEVIPVEKETEKPAGKIMASPRAKKLAADLGVDLSSVTGTGPAGKITEQDVKNAAEKKTVSQECAPQSQVGHGKRIPVSKLLKITGEKMLKSKQEIPCFYLTTKADVTGMVELRQEMNQDSDIKFAYNDFIIKAVAKGLEQFPIMTGQLDGAEIVLSDSINIGLAIEVGENLVAPILKNMNTKTLKEIAAESKAIIEKARNDKLELTDLECGCITVSNLGAFGIENFIPIVVPGQCSILGIGQITGTCVPNDGNILVKKLMNMTLSVDHKVANGSYAARFLDFVKYQLENPESLV